MRQINLPPHVIVSLEPSEIKVVVKSCWHRIRELKRMDASQLCAYDKDAREGELEANLSLYYQMGQLYNVSKEWLDHMLATEDYTWIW